MGNCCSCLDPKDGSDRFSEGSSAASPSHGQRGYGTIRTKTSDPWVPTKDTDKLVKSSSARPKHVDKPLKREAAIPKENLQPAGGEVQVETQETDVKEDEAISEDSERTTEKSERITGEEAGHVTFAPLPPSSNQSEDTPGDETISESDTAMLVSNERNNKKERDSKKKKKHISFGVTSKVTKTAGKMKRALTKHEKEDRRRKDQEKLSDRGSPGNFERGKLERVSSSRMKSKYAREKMEKIEREREEKERLRQQTQGFRDPRKAAAERGERLGELENATTAMRNNAAGFAQTTKQLAMKK